MTNRFHRRKLLKKAAAALGAAAGAKLFGAPYLLAERSPNAKLATAVIGCANQGIASVSAAVTERLVALVDVDEGHMAKTMNWIEEYAPDVKPSRIKTFHDYRQMFDKVHKEIDAVFVATPDHHHAPAAMRECRVCATSSAAAAPEALSLHDGCGWHRWATITISSTSLPEPPSAGMRALTTSMAPS